ncbi:hypothetical protein JRQ81_013684 [Phrynocephalus forsythii]|uniref:Uncharacterized protein n=1 Tax=Phrynocephalus forsythii TaxID=171643 RepID=A0A9Q0Y2X8_9SAUR|nr:hypothetical protein JRQ81_013684 [Phrynocephalus forsythii]
MHVKNAVLACGPCRDQEDVLWGERTPHLSNDREFQDSASQVAATITIMAAHAEDDNRTIFLSSPDSAVGVQWPYVSPSSDQDSGKTSPFFDLLQPGTETTTRANGPGLESQMNSKKFIGETPAIPPKMNKGSPPRTEGSLAPSISCAVENSDTNGHEEVAVPSHGGNDVAFGASTSLGTPTNRLSLEESSKGPSSLGSERRQKYCNLAWNKQCRIEEEEEEEQGFSKSPTEVETEKGAVQSASTSDCHQGRNYSVQEGRTRGISKSASFAFEFPKEKNGIEEFAPPPPPPKKQSRHFLKMNQSNSELERLNGDSTENLTPPFQGIHVSFTAGSTDSLNLDTNALSNGGFMMLCCTQSRGEANFLLSKGSF